VSSVFPVGDVVNPPCAGADGPEYSRLRLPSRDPGRRPPLDSRPCVPTLRGMTRRVATLVLFGLAAVLAAVAWSSVRTTADAEAQVIGQVLSSDPGPADHATAAMHARAQALFEGGAVADAVRAELGGDSGAVVPDRVSLTAEPDAILLHVVGHDSDPATAAALANTAARALVDAGADQFSVLAPAAAGHATTSLVPGTIRAAVPMALAAAVSVGAALGLLVGRLPVRRAVGTARA
jgi:capsular polysaccharide biosynthesis protein